MTRGALLRAGPIHWCWLVLFCLAWSGRGVASAQVADTLPADTVGVDTVRVEIPPESTVPGPVPTDSAVADSAVPVPPFPRYPRPGRSGWAFRRWEWDRQELLRYHSLSLLQLLESVPGISALRLGDFGEPAEAVTLGGGGARVRVYLDGFELDPLGATSYDLQQIALGDLESVRIERRLDGIRVDLIPMRLPDARPLSAVEAATGVYDTKLLRALLMRGIGSRTTVAAGFDQVSSRGVGFDQPFSYSAARASVSYSLAPRTALQAEIRSENAESGGSTIPVDANRRTLILRVRSELLPGLVVDGMLGRATRRPEEADSLDVELSAGQAVVRAAYDAGRLWVEGAARMRTDADALGLPASELTARGGLILMPSVVAEGELRSEGISGLAGNRGNATIRLGPLAGLSAFATLGFGEQLLALVRDTAIMYPVGPAEDGDFEERVEPRFSRVSASSGGLRLGADWGLPSGGVGAAAVLVPEGISAPFGFRAEGLASAPVTVGSARGVEAYASVPIPLTREFLRVEGWFTYWSELGGRPYLPEQEGRVALDAHGIFFGGDLEPSLRIEAVRRGSMMIPAVAQSEARAVTAPYTLANLQLEIRILDVRAFFVFDNLTNIQTAADFPGRPLPGSRLYYGLRWTFRN